MFSKLKNENGVILVTVILLIIVLSIVAIGVMSLNVSQIKTSSSVVSAIQAEELSTGVFFQDYQRRIEGKPVSATNSYTIGSNTYTITRGADGNQNGPNGTNQIQFNITY